MDTKDIGATLKKIPWWGYAAGGGVVLALAYFIHKEMSGSSTPATSTSTPNTSTAATSSDMLASTNQGLEMADLAGMPYSTFDPSYDSDPYQSNNPSGYDLDTTPASGAPPDVDPDGGYSPGNQPSPVPLSSDGGYEPGNEPGHPGGPKPNPGPPIAPPPGTKPPVKPPAGGPPQPSPRPKPSPGPPQPSPAGGPKPPNPGPPQPSPGGGPTSNPPAYWHEVHAWPAWDSTLGGIAEHYSMSWQQLYEFGNDKDIIDNTAHQHGHYTDEYNWLFPGEELQVPNAN